MALFVNGVLVLRSGWLQGRVDILTLGVAVLTMSALMLGFSLWRGRVILSAKMVPSALHIAPPLFIAGVCGLACVAGFLAVVHRLHLVGCNV